MRWFDRLSARLQPYRNTLFLALVAALLLYLPIPLVLAWTFGMDVLALLCVCVLFAAFGWLSLLYCVAYWFAPGRGPASPEVLRESHWIIALYGRCFRFFAPLLLPVMFLFALLPLLLMWFGW
ncbi:MAG: hypothetical protein U0793_28395 [Gemmataceae bacterium]